MSALAEHILAMANDPYLAEHPGWEELIKEAHAIVSDAIEHARKIQRLFPENSYAWNEAAVTLDRAGWHARR